MAVLLCGAAGCAAPAGGPDPNTAMPHYEPGETFRFADGREFRVAEIGPNQIVWMTADGARQAGSRDIFLPLSEGTDGRTRFTRVVTDRQGELWPPRVGRSSVFRASLRSGGTETPELWSCTLREMAVVEIRLGRFEVFPVACDVLRGSGAARQTETSVSYYAPRLRYFVRLERHDAAGRTVVTDLTDLLTVDSPLPAPALARRDAAMQAALENVPSGRDIGWRDSDGATTGRVRPIRTFKAANGSFCREFEEDTATPQRFDRNRRIACRQAEGIWVEVEPTA